MLNSDHCRQFAQAIYNSTGASIELHPDGELHRFDDPEGKRHNRACWYVLHLDGWPAGAFGNWRTGVTYTWRADGARGHDRKEGARIAAAIEAAKRQRKREKAEAQTQAARRARRLWSEAQPATVDHPYLNRKRVPALGLRQHGGVLLVPLRTVTGELVNFQRIFPDGTKRFLKGGRITGAFWLLGKQIPDAGTLYVAEGVATAATIAATLRQPVVAAMNAGNLIPVARALHARYPELALVMAADNDHRTPSNPGMRKATEAARAVSGALTWPRVCGEDGCQCTDFNDLANCARKVAA